MATVVEGSKKTRKWNILVYYTYSEKADDEVINQLIESVGEELRIDSFGKLHVFRGDKGIVLVYQVPYRLYQHGAGEEPEEYPGITYVITNVPDIKVRGEDILEHWNPREELSDAIHRISVELARAKTNEYDNEVRKTIISDILHEILKE